MTLTEFLTQRIAEDEQAVRDIDPVHWSELRYMTPGYTLDKALAECDAKRRIIEQCRGDMPADMELDPEIVDEPDAAIVLRLLALPYADSPEFDESWRP